MPYMSSNERDVEKELQILRFKVDEVDSKLIREVVDRLVERRKIVEEIGELKKENKKEVRNEKRRREVVQHWKNGAGRDVSMEVMGEIASAVVDEAERIEKN